MKVMEVMLVNGKAIKILALCFLTAVLAGTIAYIKIASDRQEEVVTVAAGILHGNLEVALPSGISGQPFEYQAYWIQLDQLKTMPTLRKDFDRALDVTISNGSKVGIIYIDRNGAYNGNVTLADALRNKAFIDNVWNNKAIMGELAQTIDKVYGDITPADGAATMAAFNAYYNLVGDAKDASGKDVFDANGVLSREQFMASLFKSCTPVSDLNYNPATDAYTIATGGETGYSMFASRMAPFYYLDYSDGGLNANNASAPMTKIEAIHLTMSYFFGDQLRAYTPSKAAAFSDAKDRGDVAGEMGYKVVDKKAGTTTYAKAYELGVLAEVLKNPTKGLDTELYKALVLAKDLGVYNGDASGLSNWNTALTRADAIRLIVNVQLALNNNQGYLTSTRQGTFDKAPSLDEIPQQQQQSPIGANGGGYVETEVSPGGGLTDEQMQPDTTPNAGSSSSSAGSSGSQAPSSSQAPAQSSSQAPAQSSSQAPAQSSSQAPAQSSSQAPAQSSSQAPAQSGSQGQLPPGFEWSTGNTDGGQAKMGGMTGDYSGNGGLK